MNTLTTEYPNPLLLILLVLVVAMAVFPVQCTRVQVGDKPNVVIIFIDDMGYGDLSCYGNPVMETPNIDRIAENGTRLTNFYVNSPICSPSRVALNTGRYPMRYSIHSYIAGSKANRERAMADYLDPEALTMARIFKQNGYATGHFGKWHMGGGRDLGNVPYPAEYGFDRSLVSFEGIGDRVLFPGDDLCGQSAALGRGRIIWAEKHRATSIYVDSALAFIRRNADKPFFVHLFPNDVHDPHLPDSSLMAGYREVTDNPWEQRFFAVLNELDTQIGRFMDALDEMGELEHTILIFTSDNGPTDWPYYYDRDRYPEGYGGALYPPGFTGGLFGRKWSLYEGGIRVPFIIQWKGHIPEGATEDETILAAMDLLPSLVALAGIDGSVQVDGEDMSTALLGHPMKRKDPVMWEYASNPGGSIMPGNEAFISPCLAIRDGNWKLLINTDSTCAELYDLEKDPAEQDNLVREQSTLAGELASRLLAWRRSMPVAFPE
jgi:arylsulfatase A-like enzyme